MTDFRRVTEMSGAWDKRHKNPAKNYGIHGMELRFVLTGPAGAVQFVVYTQIHLDIVARELWAKRDQPYAYETSRPMGADIGYHSPVPMYEGQTVQQDSCEYLDGRPCYYDGSGLRADEFMPEFLAGGSNAVWAMLGREYAGRFGGAK